MAWQAFRGELGDGFTGDEAADELAAALDQLGRAYSRRFGRKPLVAEVLVSLERVLSSNPARFVADPEGLGDARLSLRREPTRRRPLDPGSFEGVYADSPVPQHQVFRRGPDRQLTGEVVLSVPVLEVRGGVLVIEYTILDSSIDDVGAEQLIVSCLLSELMVHTYRKKATTISLRNRGSGAERTLPYPR